MSDRRSPTQVHRTDDALVLCDGDDELTLPSARIVDVEVNVPFREPRRDDSRRTVTVVLQPGSVTRVSLPRGLRRWLVADDVLDVPAHRTSGFEHELAEAEPPAPQQGRSTGLAAGRWSVAHGFRGRRDRLAVLPSYGITLGSWVGAAFIAVAGVEAPLPHPVLRVVVVAVAITIAALPALLRWSISADGVTRGSWGPARGRLAVHEPWRQGEPLRIRSDTHLGSSLQYGPTVSVSMLRTHRLVGVVANAYEVGLVPEHVELLVDRRLSRRSRRRLEVAGVPWFDVRPTRPWRRERAHVGSPRPASRS